MMRGGPRSIVLVISSNQASVYNIFTSAGSPTDPVAVLVTINAGVVLQAGLNTGSAWASGSTVTVVNHGIIAGIGGGDTAGTFGAGGFATAVTLTEGQDGKAGGDAVTMGWDLSIDNTDGFVYGGGGMGGGGGSAARFNPPAGSNAAAGGGGGGGRGYNNASGGDKGQDNGVNTTSPTDGANGSSSSYGAGGTRGTSSSFFSYNGGDGGRGGDWGQAGVAGDAGTTTDGTATTKPGGAGGAAGKAVAKNGKTLTWLGGNNGTQVKGAQT